MGKIQRKDVVLQLRDYFMIGDFAQLVRAALASVPQEDARAPLTDHDRWLPREVSRREIVATRAALLKIGQYADVLAWAFEVRAYERHRAGRETIAEITAYPGIAIRTLSARYGLEQAEKDSPGNHDSERGIVGYIEGLPAQSLMRRAIVTETLETFDAALTAYIAARHHRVIPPEPTGGVHIVSRRAA